MMQRVKIVLVLAVILAVGWLGYTQVVAFKNRSSAQAEIKTQQAEVEKCKQNLTLFYQAWKNYKADHKGADPADVSLLVPKYIPDPTLLVCPTAQRWMNNHKAIDHGKITINKHEYLETYGFEWLGTNAARAIKRQGDKAPLVFCSAHEEGLYISIFHKRPQMGAFDDDKRKQYVSELQNAHPLAVRRNGTVEELSADEE